MLANEHALDKDKQSRSRADSLVSNSTSGSFFILNIIECPGEESSNEQRNQSSRVTTSRESPEAHSKRNHKRIGNTWSADFLDGYLAILEEHLARYLTPGGSIKTPFWTLARREFEAKFGAKRSMHTIRQYYNNIKKKLFERFELESKSGLGVDDQGRICCDSEVWAVFSAVSI